MLNNAGSFSRGPKHSVRPFGWPAQVIHRNAQPAVFAQILFRTKNHIDFAQAPTSNITWYHTMLASVNHLLRTLRRRPLRHRINSVNLHVRTRMIHQLVNDIWWRVRVLRDRGRDCSVNGRRER